MIILSEVAKKVSAVLNGEDSETASLTRPTSFRFVVAAQGIHLDSIDDRDTGDNAIPVFVSSMGGSVNPIPGLGQSAASVPITFYFPVRFKEDLFALNGFLAEAFVGTRLNYGAGSGICTSNISIATYGEIQGLDLKEFKEWAGNRYRKRIEVMEPYMSMTVTLYLSSASEGYAFGNDASISLSFELGGETYSESDVVFDDASIQSVSQPSTQQLIGDDYSTGMPFGTAYSVGFKIYYKDDDFCNALLQEWLDGSIQSLRIAVSLQVGSLSFSMDCYVQSVNMIISKGNPIGITLALSRAD